MDYIYLIPTAGIIAFNRWRKELGDLETFTIGVIVLLNAAENKSFKLKECLMLKQECQIYLLKILSR